MIANSPKGKFLIIECEKVQNNPNKQGNHFKILTVLIQPMRRMAFYLALDLSLSTISCRGRFFSRHFLKALIRNMYGIWQQGMSANCGYY